MIKRVKRWFVLSMPQKSPLKCFWHDYSNYVSSALKCTASTYIGSESQVADSIYSRVTTVIIPISIKTAVTTNS